MIIWGKTEEWMSTQVCLKPGPPTSSPVPSAGPLLGSWHLLLPLPGTQFRSFRDQPRCPLIGKAFPDHPVSHLLGSYYYLFSDTCEPVRCLTSPQENIRSMSTGTPPVQLLLHSQLLGQCQAQSNSSIRGGTEPELEELEKLKGQAPK